MRPIGPFFPMNRIPAAAVAVAAIARIADMTTRIAGARCPKCSGTAFEILHVGETDQAQFVCLKCEWRGSFAQILPRPGNGKTAEN